MRSAAPGAGRDRRDRRAAGHGCASSAERPRSDAGGGSRHSERAIPSSRGTPGASRSRRRLLPSQLLERREESGRRRSSGRRPRKLEHQPVGVGGVETERHVRCPAARARASAARASRRRLPNPHARRPAAARSRAPRWPLLSVARRRTPSPPRRRATQPRGHPQPSSTTRSPPPARRLDQDDRAAAGGRLAEGTAAGNGVGDELAADANGGVVAIRRSPRRPGSGLGIEGGRGRDQDRLGAVRLGMLDRNDRRDQPSQDGVGVGAENRLEGVSERCRILTDADRQQGDPGAARRTDNRL